MTRLLRRAVLAMVAASAGIVLHGQTTTADNALFDLGGLPAVDRRTDPTSALLLPGDIPGQPPTITLPELPSPPLRPTLPMLPTLPVLPGNRPTPAPPSPDPDAGQPIPPSPDPDADQPTPPSPDPDLGQPIPPSPDPDLGQPIPPIIDPDVGQPIPPIIDPDVGQPIPPSAGPLSPVPNVGTPLGPDDAGSPRRDDAGESGDPEPSTGDATDGDVDALPPPGPADDVTTPATGSTGRGAVATTAAGGATGGATAIDLTGAPQAAVTSGAAAVAPQRLRSSDRTVDLAANDTNASGRGTDAELESPGPETWVPSGGGRQALPLVARLSCWRCSAHCGS